MARHFVRLKLALLAASFKLSIRQAIGFVLSVVAGIPLGIAGFALMVWLGGETAGGTGLRLAFAALTLLWILGPPLLFGLDETLDPARLRLLPLSPWQRARGLLAASAVGVGPAVTLLVLLGALVGFAPRGPGAVLVVAAVVAQFVLCLVVARSLTTVLSQWLRSRRGQDVVVLVGAALALLAAGAGQLPTLLGAVVEDYGMVASTLDRIDTVVGATPLAWAGSSVVAAADGRWLVSVGWLVATAALVAVLLTVWTHALSRVAVTVAETRSGADVDLFSGLAAVLPRTRMGAAAARELRYQWRVPQLRVQWLIMPLIGLALVVGSLVVPNDASPLLVLGVCGVVAFHGFSAINALGGDRGAVWLLVSAGGIGRADLAGKNLAGAIVLLPLALLLALLLAATTGGWTYVPGAVLACVAVLGCAYGLGNVVSVLTPVPLPESTSNVWASSSGAGCAAAFAQGLAMMVGTLLLGPAVVAYALTVAFAASWLTLVGFLVAAYGIGIWWLGLMLATRFADGRGPEIVAALGKRS